ncbi:MAG: hypothetical protein IKO72_00725, partial [Kiritimatiellae bacterium]|nr:hypothetical protein [Kiritimatiellia bacterium]
MPLTWISYMVDISLFGRGSAGHHLVNVIVHLANVLLLFRLACRMSHAHGSDSTPYKHFLLQGSLLLTLFWALHPQRTEAVAWIASRKELLWAFFTLLGLAAWRGGRSFAALACCVLACMSKPTAMVFPLLALLVGTEQKPQTALKPLTALKHLTTLKPLMALRPLIALSFMFVISVATGVLAIYSQTHPEGMAAKDVFYAPLGERLVNAAVSVGLYLAQMVVPIGIHLDYRVVPGGWPLHGGLGLAVFALAILAVGIGFKGLKGFKGLATFECSLVIKGVLFFAVALLPVLGIFGSFGEHARADRFLYVPAMALPLFASGWLSRISRSLQLAMLTILLLFACMSFRIASTYRDDLSAFTRTLSCDPGHGRALAHVGEARCAAGALDEGIDMLRRSRAVRPRDATDGKLAYALMRRGRSADWDEIRAVCAPYASDPARDGKGQALEALGTAELKSRDWSSAASHLSRSILAPARFYSSADAKLKLAYAWHNGGRRADARKLFEAIARSTRTDLANRAEEVLSVLERSPNAMLFW